MRVAGLLVALLLVAGCAAPPAVPAPPPPDDGVTAVAYRVEPTITVLDRVDEFGLGLLDCSTNKIACEAAPTFFGEPVWTVEASDAEAVFWRLDATLSWQNPSGEELRVDLYALRMGTCTNSNNSEEYACQRARHVEGVVGSSPQHMAGEFFLEPGEQAVRLEVRPISPTPGVPPPIDREARLEGRIASYHPVSGPIALNVTAE